MPNVGEIIKAEREKKGLSIKDIEKGTSIRGLYLQAIEEENYSIAPGEVYLKGFIRNYANYLGLNGQEMVNMYKESQKAATAALPVTEEENIQTQPQPEQRRTERRISSSRSSRSKQWIAVVAALVIVSGIYVWQANSSTPTPKQDKPTPETTAVQPAQQVPVQPAQQSAAQTKPVMITAKYTDACWTSVTADGKHVFEGTPKAGESLTWDAQQKIKIRLGNAGAVDLTHNGKAIGKIGGSGEVTVKTFTK